MILAAAVKYEVEATGKEVILCGARHCDIFNQLKGLGFKPQQGYKMVAQGFIDQENNFLTREEAYEHAKTCGQLCTSIIIMREEFNPFGKQLMTEDLW